MFYLYGQHEDIQNVCTYAEKDNISVGGNDIDKTSTSDEFFVHPLPNTHCDETTENKNNYADEQKDDDVSAIPHSDEDTQDFYEKIAKALAIHKKDESVIHPPPVSYYKCIKNIIIQIWFS